MASARLAGDGYLSKWLECLRDSRRGVARQASLALRPYAGRLLADLLSLVSDQQQALHSRGLALQLVERADKWASLPVLIGLIQSELGEKAQICLQRWLGSANRRQIAPTAAQLQKCARALAVSGWTGPQRDEIEHLVTMASGYRSIVASPTGRTEMWGMYPAKAPAAAAPYPDARLPRGGQRLPGMCWR